MKKFFLFFAIVSFGTASFAVQDTVTIKGPISVWTNVKPIVLSIDSVKEQIRQTNEALVVNIAATNNVANAIVAQTATQRVYLLALIVVLGFGLIGIILVIVITRNRYPNGQFTQNYHYYWHHQPWWHHQQPPFQATPPNTVNIVVPPGITVNVTVR